MTRPDRRHRTTVPLLVAALAVTTASAADALGPRQPVDTSDWTLDECIDNDGELESLGYVVPDPDVLDAAAEGRLVMTLQGSRWRPKLGVPAGTTVEIFARVIDEILISGPGTLDCSRSVNANGVFLDLTAHVLDRW